jgi:hypothetical protein
MSKKIASGNAAAAFLIPFAPESAVIKVQSGISCFNVADRVARLSLSPTARIFTVPSFPHCLPILEFSSERIPDKSTWDTIGLAAADIPLSTPFVVSTPDNNRNSSRRLNGAYFFYQANDAAGRIRKEMPRSHVTIINPYT